MLNKGVVSGRAQKPHSTITNGKEKVYLPAEIALAKQFPSSMMVTAKMVVARASTERPTERPWMIFEEFLQVPLHFYFKLAFQHVRLVKKDATQAEGYPILNSAPSNKFRLPLMDGTILHFDGFQLVIPRLRSFDE